MLVKFYKCEVGYDVTLSPWQQMLERYDESFFDLATLLKKDPKNSAARREFQVVIGYREEVSREPGITEHLP